MLVSMCHDGCSPLLNNLVLVIPLPTLTTCCTATRAQPHHGSTAIKCMFCRHNLHNLNKGPCTSSPRQHSHGVVAGHASVVGAQGGVADGAAQPPLSLVPRQLRVLVGTQEVLGLLQKEKDKLVC